MKRTRLLQILLWALSFLLLSLVTLHHHKQNRYGHWRGHLWGDKAGYYVYLPYAFHYHFSTQNLPDSLRARTGLGFAIEEGKIITKYPLGVAYMEAPFYALGALQSSFEKKKEHPFANPYAGWVILAGPFWVSWGLLWLYGALGLLGLRAGPRLLALGTLLGGTSLFYYASIEGLMSHSFSFAALAGLAFQFLQLLRGKASRWTAFWLALFAVLTVAIRPFNILMLPFYFLSMAALFPAPWSRTREVLPAFAGSLLLWGILLLGPQLLYYQHAYGQWLIDSYQKEYFNFAEPHLYEMFFDPVQGLFLYVPAFALVLTWLAIRLWQSPRAYTPLWMMMLSLSYLYASWHSWHFGCGFGIRVFVDWLPLLWLAAAPLWHRRAKALLALGALSAVLVGYNLWLSFRWTGCWFQPEKNMRAFWELFFGG